MGETRLAIVVMTRSSAKGRIREGFRGSISAEQAATLHLVFLLRSVQRLEGVAAGELIVCYDPPEAGEVMPDLMGWFDAQRLLPQVDGDYGERVAAAVETLRGERGFARVLLLGVDTPDVPADHVRLAADLTATADLTLGPTDHGGFWCLGFGGRSDARGLLAKVPWSTGGEAQALLERARSTGLVTQLAPRWNEVDRPAELERLVERLAPSGDPDDVRLLAELERTVPRKPLS